MMRIALAAAALLVMTACGEKPQSLQGVKQHVPAFQGGSAAPFMAQGWKPGDKGSWEQHLKTRAQTGQNDYTKVN
jgi:hypothetical protein